MRRGVRQPSMRRACIRRMRMAVSFVLHLVANGMSREDIVREFPELEAEDIRQSLPIRLRAPDERAIFIVADPGPYCDPRLKRRNEGASLRAATKSSFPFPSRSPAAIPYMAPRPSPKGRDSNFFPVPSL